MVGYFVERQKQAGRATKNSDSSYWLAQSLEGVSWAKTWAANNDEEFSEHLKFNLIRTIERMYRKEKEIESLELNISPTEIAGDCLLLLQCNNYSDYELKVKQFFERNELSVPEIFEVNNGSEFQEFIQDSIQHTGTSRDDSWRSEIKLEK